MRVNPALRSSSRLGVKMWVIAEGILLGDIGCGTIEVVPAAADLNAIHGSKAGGREGVDVVVGEARRRSRLLSLKLVVDPSVVGVVVLRLVRADGEVVGRGCCWSAPETASGSSA